MIKIICHRFFGKTFHAIFWNNKDFQRTGQYLGLDTGQRAAIDRYTDTWRSAIGQCTVKSRVDWTKAHHVTFWRLTDVTLSWLEVDSQLQHFQLYWNCEFSKADRGLLVLLVVLAKLRKANVASSCQSVCLSAWNDLAPTGRICIKFDIWVFLENLYRKIKFYYSRTRTAGTLYERQHTLLVTSRAVLIRLRNASG